jgi:hypothetical protein
MNKTKRIKTIQGLIIYSIIALFSAAASALPSYVSELPKDRMTAGQALKQAKSGKVVFKCQLARVTEAAGIGKAKRAKTVWVSAVTHSDEALETIENGGKGYKCQAMEYDSESRRLANSQQDVE